MFLKKPESSGKPSASLRGQRIDLSLLETQVASLVNIASSYLVSGQIPKRWGTAHETIVPYQEFETRDKYVIVAVGNDQLWVKFCKVIGRPELADDPHFSVSIPARFLAKYWAMMNRKLKG